MFKTALKGGIDSFNILSTVCLIKTSINTNKFENEVGDWCPKEACYK